VVMVMKELVNFGHQKEVANANQAPRQATQTKHSQLWSLTITNEAPRSKTKRGVIES
jgi:hypothetical protein